MKQINTTWVGKEVLLLSREHYYNAGTNYLMPISLHYERVDSPEPPASIIKDKPLTWSTGKGLLYIMRYRSETPLRLNTKALFNAEP